MPICINAYAVCGRYVSISGWKDEDIAQKRGRRRSGVFTPLIHRS